ncbi:hypothetical protein [Pelagicoccus albus]|uniref:Uncharacterized protein n=1 Tax=Pelagicoccus albus TaxID=415222 RepID=A0A7X1B938_9BACT|nr:hypothetical protein [Pelagicoccus albus]MBC2607831.1 hypothetical protein [Pelagicoccus albus]
MRNILRMLALLGTAGTMHLFTGCGGGHDHDHDHEVGHEHVHHAPHGGALGMLGDHAFQIEIAPDADGGKVDLYVLDGEAENFIRIAAPAIAAVAEVAGSEQPLLFQAVASEATGETVGDSSHFSVLAPELAMKSEFEITFAELELLGQVFESVSIPYPEGTHGD